MSQLNIGELKAKIPVIQGGMGVGISLSGLAGAVAAEGGIGVISAAQIGYREEGFAKNPLEANLRAIATEIKKAREIAKGGILGINIMVATRGYEEYVRAAVDAGIDLIISGAGLPVDLPGLVQDAGTKIAPIVSSVKSADVILKYWWKKYRRLPDLLVIEGPRAGGHLGFTEEELADIAALDYDRTVKEIIAHIRQYEEREQQRIPVVVAGGVYERSDYEHYKALGADGVQMATRFVTTYECDADPRYKQAYIDAAKEDIMIVKSPVGMPGRAIRNTFMSSGGKKPARCFQCLRKCVPEQIPYCITEALIHAAKGETDEALLFCGDNAYRAARLEHVADIMSEFKEKKE